MIPTLSTVSLALAAAAPLHAQCTFEGIPTPYGTEPYRLVEWNGHYYDAGWFHLRHRPIEGGEWVATGGGLFGGGTAQFAEAAVEWNGMLVVGGNFAGGGEVTSRGVIGWNGREFVALGSGLAGEVTDLLVWNGRLVAGGHFFTTGAGAPVSLVAVFDEETGEWAPLGEGLGNLPSGYSSWAIGQLCVHDGALHATGRFRSSGATTLNGVARFDESLGAWRPLGSGIAGMVDGNVGTALASFDGRLWLSGWFGSVGGVAAPWMAIWNGKSWTPADAPVTRHALELVAHGGQLWGVGPGTFSVGDIARFDGVSWHGVASSDINWPNSLTPTADGAGLLTCGNFQTIGDAEANLVRFDCGLGSTCEPDLDGDGMVGASDLATLLGAWGSAGADLDGDGVTGASDLARMLGDWGACGG
jgi:hypothetical protein